MFGRLGWAEILVIVVLLVILFGHNKIPTMMRNLANGINVFKSELKNKSGKDEKSSEVAPKTVKKPVKKAKKSVTVGKSKNKIKK